MKPVNLNRRPRITRRGSVNQPRSWPGHVTREPCDSRARAMRRTWARALRRTWARSRRAASARAPLPRLSIVRATDKWLGRFAHVRRKPQRRGSSKGTRKEQTRGRDKSVSTHSIITRGSTIRECGQSIPPLYMYMEADTYVCDVHPRLARAMTTCVRNACRALRVLLTVFRETMRETQFAPDNGVNTCNGSDKSSFLSCARNCTNNDRR